MIIVTVLIESVKWSSWNIFLRNYQFSDNSVYHVFISHSILIRNFKELKLYISDSIKMWKNYAIFFKTFSGLNLQFIVELK